MKEFAAAFYKSKAWKDCRAAYMRSVGGLCERCLARGLYVPGEIVHHRAHITPETIGDPAVTLSWDNLECVCRECHAELHQGEVQEAGRKRRRPRRFIIDERGRVTVR